MIKITILSNDDGIVGFTTKGHAMYDESGKDIVCAAVSTLVINAINSIENFTKCKCSVDEDSETGYIKFRILDKPTHDTNLLLESMVFGLSYLCQELENDGEYIQITTKEV